MPINVDLYLLSEGSTADLQRFRSAERGPVLASPFDLPYDPIQCVHVDAVYSMENGKSKASAVRCVEKADPSGQNGWLCQTHKELLVKLQGRAKKVHSADAESILIDSILKSEARAIKAGVRTFGRVGREKINYLE